MCDEKQSRAVTPEQRGTDEASPIIAPGHRKAVPDPSTEEKPKSTVKPDTESRGQGGLGSWKLQSRTQEGAKRKKKDTRKDFP